jgi:hypothetical protein
MSAPASASPSRDDGEAKHEPWLAAGTQLARGRLTRRSPHATPDRGSHPSPSRRGSRGSAHRRSPSLRCHPRCSRHHRSRRRCPCRLCRSRRRSRPRCSCRLPRPGRRRHYCRRRCCCRCSRPHCWYRCSHRVAHAGPRPGRGATIAAALLLPLLPPHCCYRCSTRIAAIAAVPTRATAAAVPTRAIAAAVPTRATAAAAAGSVVPCRLLNRLAGNGDRSACWSTPRRRPVNSRAS